MRLELAKCEGTLRGSRRDAATHEEVCELLDGLFRLGPLPHLKVRQIPRVVPWDGSAQRRRHTPTYIYRYNCEALSRVVRHQQHEEPYETVSLSEPSLTLNIHVLHSLYLSGRPPFLSTITSAQSHTASCPPTIDTISRTWLYSYCSQTESNTSPDEF